MIRAEYDNTNCEGPDAGSKEFTCLNLIQTKGTGPKRLGVDQECPGDKGKCGCDEGDEASPKQFHVRFRILITHSLLMGWLL